MSKISSLVVEEKKAEVEYPEIEGFIITLQYLGREALNRIRNHSLKIKFNKVSRQREEEIDNDKFLELYAEKAIVGWKGLKIKDLNKLFPIKIDDSLNPDEEILYTSEEALDLLKASSVFDQFITDAMNDLEVFESTIKKEKEKN